MANIDDKEDTHIKNISKLMKKANSQLMLQDVSKLQGRSFTVLRQYVPFQQMGYLVLNV